MTYITSIGLDVHARSVSACAFDPFTGEVAQRRFGTDAGEIAEWILGFESPKAVYESGPTGFALCRELRALGVDCVVGAVSKMQKPSAEKRRKTTGAPAFLARLLATRNITRCGCRPSRRRPPATCRALERRFRVRLGDPAALFGQQPAHDLLAVRRDRLPRSGARTRSPGRGRSGGGRSPAGRPTRAAAAAFDHYVASVRCAESDKRALEKRVPPRTRAELAGGARSRRSRASRASTPSRRSACATEARCFSRFPTAGAYASWLGLVPSEHSSGETEPKAASPRPGTPPPGAPYVEAAWHFKSCSPEAQGAAGRLGRAGGREAALRRTPPRASEPEARIPRAAGKTRPAVANVAVAPRARLLGLGGRQARRGDAPRSSPGPT